MLTEISQIEGVVSELEQTLPAISDPKIFERLIELRQCAFSKWINEDPASLVADPSAGCRDRITNIEQRLLNLAAQIPADSISNMQLKMKLWILFKDLPNAGIQTQDISDDLIVSLFWDLTRAKTNSAAAVSDITDFQRPKSVS